MSFDPCRIRIFHIAFTAVLSATLVACGGGGADESVADPPLTGAPTPPATVPSGVLINEVHTANWKGDEDEDGDAEDWVELHNPTSERISLAGWGLGNKSSSVRRWMFPAAAAIEPQGYLTVWLSKKNRQVAAQPLHASFNLDNGDDALYLSATDSNGEAVIADTTAPPAVRPDHSWCRLPADGGTAAFAICAAAGAQIRYTTDGSEPTTASPLYSGPITVAASGVIRASAFASGALASPPQSASYIVDAAMTSRYVALKSVFVALPPAELQRFSQRDDDWRGVAAVEMLSAGKRLFALDAEASVAGQFGSGDSPQVSMNVAARDALGVKSIKATLWPDKPAITSTKKFRLRKGSNDWARAHLRDQLSQRAAGGGPNLYGSSNTVAMFVNGRYYGMMDLREREDETLAANNLAIDNDFIDDLDDPLLEGEDINSGGDAALAAYTTFERFVTGNDMSAAAAYGNVKSMIAPESLAWDWAHHMFHGNSDWPDRNVHVWRSAAYDGLWRWHPHDMDFAFGRYLGPEVDMNFGSYRKAGSGFFNALLANAEFRTLYVNAIADQMNLMTASRMNALLDTMAADMQPYVADYYAANAMGSEATWRGHVDALRLYFLEREPWFDQHSREHLQLASRGAVNVRVNDTSRGSVKVNLLDTAALMSAADPSFSGRYYPGVPITLTALPKPGFRFAGWQGSASSSERTITHTLPAASPVNADSFSVRWSGQLRAPASGSYTLRTRSDDGVRVRLGGNLVIDNWSAHSVSDNTAAAVTLAAGQRIDIVVEYFDDRGDATMRLLWLPPGAPHFMPIPATQLHATAADSASSGLAASYYNNTTLTGTPAAQAVEAVDFAWRSLAPTPSAARFIAVFEAAGTPAAPTLSAVPAQTWRTGELVSLRVLASDPLAHRLTFSADDLPKGLSIQPATGMVYGRLTTPGAVSSTIRASNGVSTGSIVVPWTVSDAASP
jgi:CotH kinase protein/PA14 domain/Lamin Tail Domain/Chitobiase/beta-hexosaminidase C-terminal domain/Divergent InlB B-repeat domain/Putative Ig domain